MAFNGVPTTTESIEHSMPTATKLSEDTAMDGATVFVHLKNPNPVEQLEEN